MGLGLGLPMARRLGAEARTGITMAVKSRGDGVASALRALATQRGLRLAGTEKAATCHGQTGHNAHGSQDVVFFVAICYLLVD